MSANCACIIATYGDEVRLFGLVRFMLQSVRDYPSLVTYQAMSGSGNVTWM